MNIEAIKEQAKKELDDEEFRSKVEKYKNKLREKRSLIDIIFPYRIIIIKKGEKNV